MKEAKKSKGESLPIQAAIAEPDVLVKNAGAIKQFQQQGEALLAEAMTIEIVDDASRERMAEVRERGRQMVKAVDAKFDTARDTAYKIYLLVKDRISGMKRDPEEAQKIAERKMSNYDLKREQELKAIQAEAERKRLAEEEKERQRLLAKAEKAAEKGNAEKAEELRQAAEEVIVFSPAAPIMPKTIETDSGKTSSKKDFDVRITNPKEVIAALASGHLPPGIIAAKREPEGHYSELKITAAAIKKWAEQQRLGDELPAAPPGCSIKAVFKYRGFDGNGK